MLVLDQRQQDLLLKLKENMECESDKKNIDNKVINLKTNDKIHNSINNKDIVVDKINYNTEERKPQRREIWYVNFGKKNGSIQSGIRPCIIGSNPINNKYATIRNVYPITSKLDKSNIPVHVPIVGYGLNEKSLILVEQVTTIDIRYDLKDYVGTVDELLMARVDMARNIQLGDLQEKTPLERLPKWIGDVITRKIENIYSFERVWVNSRTKNESFKTMCLKERQLCLEDLEEFCLDNKLNYKDYYVKYSESNAM